MRSILTICRKGLLVLFIVLLETASQAELLDWKVFTLPFSGNDLVFANNQFLAVGQEGIFSSPDGVAWTQRSTNWADYIGAGGGKYVAIRANRYLLQTGGHINAESLASSDGINWSQPVPFPHNYDDPGSICFGKGLFVTAGSAPRFQEGSILVSADGTNWTQTQTAGTYQGFGAVAFGNGVFSVSSWGRDLFSSDGTNWTSYSNGRPIPAYDNRLAFGNNEFVAEDPYGFRRSSDGVTWISANSAIVHELIYGDGKWVANEGPNGGGRIGVSSDLNDWTIDERFVSEFPGGTISLAYGNGRFVMLPRLAKSLVAVTHPPPKLTLFQTASNHLALTISGEVGKTNSIEASSNLVNWAQVTTFLQSIQDTSIVVTNPSWANAFFRAVPR